MEENKSTIAYSAPDYGAVRNVRKKRQKRLVRSVCYDYTQSTSLQGIPYFTKRGLTIFEKIFWILTFIVSFCMCCYLIREVWIKWQTSPVIVTVSEQLVPVIKVPLPSITICPQAKCMATVYNYTAQMRKMQSKSKHTKHNKTVFPESTFEEIEKYEGISLMCGDHKNSAKSRLNTENSQLPYHNSTALKYMAEVALDYKDIFKKCEISNKPVKCQKLFSKVVTAAGICYTMNALAAEEIFRMENIQKDFPLLNTTRRSHHWSMEHGYDDNLMSNSTFYPDRGLAIDGLPNVYILFGQMLDDHDQFCFGYSTGLNVYVHHPADLPQASLHAYSLMNDEDTLMALSFNLLNTSETLRSYDPEKRQCYFPENKQLKYFKIYTPKNCIIECLVNFTYEVCGCVQFHMPHETSDRICTLGHRECVKNAHVKLAYRESNENDLERCRCLPACNSIEYDASLLKSTINFEKAMKIIGSFHTLKQNFTKTKFSLLRIFYKSPRFVSMRRSELFGMTDFLANCGGLLSLFLGFSFLSIAEIFYFSTLRIFCALKEDRQLEKIHARENQEINGFDPNKF